MSGIHVGRKAAQLAVIDAAIIVVALFLSAIVARIGAGFAVVPHILREWTGATVIALTLHLVAFYVFELYNLQLDFRRVANVLRCVGAVLTAAAFVAVASFVLPTWGFGRKLFLVHAILLAGFTTAVRAVYSGAARNRASTERALLVVSGPVPDEVIEEFSRNPESRFDLVATVTVGTAARNPNVLKGSSTPPSAGTVAECKGALERHEARHLVVAGIDTLPQEDAQELLRFKSAGVEVHELNALYQTLTGRIPLEMTDERYFLRVPAFTTDTRPVLSNLFRLLDVLAALTIMALSSPLWLLAFVGIKLTMPGPVLYSQERVGKDEKTYTIYKFRSMRVDAEKLSGPVQSSGSGDPRVTPFGRFMRRTRIDELPQLWNVLVGDMSFVGPRPERPNFVAEYKREIPFYGLRFQIKPGLTGWAQVGYRYGNTVNDTRVKLSYDLYYVQERSIPLFALILLKTVTTVLFKPGS